ncbi:MULTISPECIES: response regulator [Bacillaceae]|uniref:response regulator n=1 Tax=Bacillaceae TaxID=186817 RepID=UPI001BE6D98A|nr:response regulator [Bacillus sp. ISL-4]MBT2667416.1 response regulator [Bacillus sp. ISL-4]MBT2673301.1 response regulator [Streptomyces sp. ISL-14]
MTNEIRVLLIEDDPMVQEVNKQFIERLPAFKVVDTASNGLEGLEKIRQSKPDLVILDIFMPSLNGVDTLYQIRKEQIDVDVIIISAANDQKTIRKMMQNGAFDYLIKPFKFDRLKHTLEQYFAFRMEVEPDHQISQTQLDRILFQNKTHSEASPKYDVPKGLNGATLEQVTKFIKTQPGSLSAEEVADGIGIARVTARRYLEYLHGEEVLQLDVQYGSIGRPVNRYRLKKP